MHLAVHFVFLVVGAHAQAVQAGYMGRRRQPETVEPGARCARERGSMGRHRRRGGPRQKTLPTTRRVARQGKRQKALGLGLDAPKRIDLGWGRSPSPERSGGQHGSKSKRPSGQAWERVARQ